MVLPMLCLVLFGTFQIGLVIFSYSAMQYAAENAARAMANCSITSSGDATTLAKKSLPPWVKSTDWTITANPGTNPVTMSISVPITSAGVLSYIPVGVGNMSTSIANQKEITAQGGAPCS